MLQAFSVYKLKIYYLNLFHIFHPLIISELTFSECLLRNLLKQSEFYNLRNSTSLYFDSFSKLEVTFDLSIKLALIYLSNLRQSRRELGIPSDFIFWEQVKVPAN